MEKENKTLAELLIDLSRNCSIKEEYFANSFNLSPTEVKILKLFAFENSYTIKEIKDKLKLTSGRIAQIVSSLEKKKIVIRVKDDNDKRNTIVNLTSKSSLLVKNLQQSYDELNKKILANINPEEKQQIEQSLNVLISVFSDWANKIEN